MGAQPTARPADRGRHRIHRRDGRTAGRDARRRTRRQRLRPHRFRHGGRPRSRGGRVRPDPVGRRPVRRRRPHARGRVVVAAARRLRAGPEGPGEIVAPGHDLAGHRRLGPEAAALAAGPRTARGRRHHLARRPPRHRHRERRARPGPARPAAERPRGQLGRHAGPPRRLGGAARLRSAAADVPRRHRLRLAGQPRRVPGRRRTGRGRLPRAGRGDRRARAGRHPSARLPARPRTRLLHRSRERARQAAAAADPALPVRHRAAIGLVPPRQDTIRCGRRVDRAARHLAGRWLDPGPQEPPQPRSGPVRRHQGTLLPVGERTAAQPGRDDQHDLRADPRSLGGRAGRAGRHDRTPGQVHGPGRRRPAALASSADPPPVPGRVGRPGDRCAGRGAAV